MRLFNASNVLILGAHTDDIELGCGGLLNRLFHQGVNISTMVFSNSQESLPPECRHNLLIDEYLESMKTVGITSNAHFKLYPVRRFSEHRQDILEDMVSVAKKYKPDLVITMSSSDIHQDHSIIYQESLRAFRKSIIIGYELPWNQFQSQNNLFIEISRDDLAAKEKMLMSYQSQIALGRPYISREYIESAAKFRGFQARLPLAEAYELISCVWRLE